MIGMVSGVRSATKPATLQHAAFMEFKFVLRTRATGPLVSEFIDPSGHEIAFDHLPNLLIRA